MSLPHFVSIPIDERVIPPRVVVVHWAFAGLLLVAAGLKAESVWDSVALPYTASSVLTISVIAVECCLAAWLLSGAAPILARRAAIVLLLTFICIASWRLANHADDCGCFGRIRVHPAWTFALDVAALLCIAWFGRRPVRSSDPHEPRRSGWPTSLRLTAAILASIAIPSSVAAASHLRFASKGEAPLIVLEPETWKGHPFPLLDEISPTMPELARGPWSVLIIDHNCQVCMDYLSRRKVEPNKESNFAIIDLAQPADQSPIQSWTELHLRPGKEYIFSGPLELTLLDGMVRDFKSAHADP